eukprot:scaffold360920_cov17-Prasinocladus_malaysianus.AAC.1
MSCASSYRSLPGLCCRACGGHLPVRVPVVGICYEYSYAVVCPYSYGIRVSAFVPCSEQKKRI